MASGADEDPPEHPSAAAVVRQPLNHILEEQGEDEGTEASPRLLMAENHHSFKAREGTILEEGEEEGGDTFPSSLDRQRLLAGRSVGASLAAPQGLRPSALSAGTQASANSQRPAGGGGGSSKYSPLPWSDFFDESFDIALPGGDTFHIYRSGSGGPVVLCLHGGGYSGLSFAAAALQIRQQQQRSAKGSTVPPGAGGSVGAVTVVAPDLRGHGLTHTSDDSDLSADMLCSDVVRVVRHLYPSDPPAIVLVGHSMGGAIAVRTAALQELPSLSGLIVIDVVEGTAMASLVHMQAILAGRPTHFPSVEKAVEWTLRNGHVRNAESARVSVPSTLVLDPSRQQCVWRAALEDSEKFWKGWYTGLSEVFLRCSVPKLLLLAGTDRLDKPLTIAQMQGKFQMLVLRHSGHAIQEDEPAEFASSLLHFIARNRINEHGTLLASWGGAIHP